MSALGQKQTCAAHKPMSAMCHKQTFVGLLKTKRPPRGGPSEIRSDVLVRWLPPPVPPGETQHAKAGGEELEVRQGEGFRLVMKRML